MQHPFKETNAEIKKIAAEFLAKHSEKDSGDVLDTVIIPALENDFHLLFTILKRYNRKIAAESLAKLIADTHGDFTYYREQMLSLFNKKAAIIAPETVSTEAAELLFSYLKEFYTKEKGYVSPELPKLHTQLMQIIFPLCGEETLLEMEEFMAKIFIKGEIDYSPFDNHYIQTTICLEAGKAKKTERFFRLIADKTRSGGNFEKAMGVMFLIAMVGGEQPEYEGWKIHLDETIDLFSEILSERKNLSAYRGTEDEQYCSIITGEYGTGLLPFVEKAVKKANRKAKKKIKTPKKHDIFERNLIPWLEAKKGGKTVKKKK